MFRYRETTDREDEKPVYEFVDRTSADVDKEAASEVLGKEVMSDAPTSGAEVEPGMDVVEVFTGHVGTVSQVVGSEIHVNPDPGLIDKAKLGLGWGIPLERRKTFSRYRKTKSKRLRATKFESTDQSKTVACSAA